MKKGTPRETRFHTSLGCAWSSIWHASNRVGKKALCLMNNVCGSWGLGVGLSHDTGSHQCWMCSGKHTAAHLVLLKHTKCLLTCCHEYGNPMHIWIEWWWGEGRGGGGGWWCVSFLCEEYQVCNNYDVLLMIKIVVMMVVVIIIILLLWYYYNIVIIWTAIDSIQSAQAQTRTFFDKGEVDDKIH